MSWLPLVVLACRAMMLLVILTSGPSCSAEDVPSSEKPSGRGDMTPHPLRLSRDLKEGQPGVHTDLQPQADKFVPETILTDFASRWWRRLTDKPLCLMAVCGGACASGDSPCTLSTYFYKLDLLGQHNAGCAGNDHEIHCGL